MTSESVYMRENVKSCFVKPGTKIRSAGETSESVYMRENVKSCHVKPGT